MKIEMCTSMLLRHDAEDDGKASPAAASAGAPEDAVAHRGGPPRRGRRGRRRRPLQRGSSPRAFQAMLQDNILCKRSHPTLTLYSSRTYSLLIPHLFFTHPPLLLKESYSLTSNLLILFQPIPHPVRTHPSLTLPLSSILPSCQSFNNFASLIEGPGTL